MRNVQEVLASVWKAMNPAEPTPTYLVTFMAFAAVAMFLAILVGQM